MLDFSLFKNRNFEKSDIKRLNLFLSLLETPINKKRPSFLKAFLVIRLGLEPRTPTLKVLCSTC